MEDKIRSLEESFKIQQQMLRLMAEKIRDMEDIVFNLNK